MHKIDLSPADKTILLRALRAWRKRLVPHGYPGTLVRDFIPRLGRSRGPSVGLTQHQLEVCITALDKFASGGRALQARMEVAHRRFSGGSS